jgi:hypothetical protein
LPHYLSSAALRRGRRLNLDGPLEGVRELLIERAPLVNEYHDTVCVSAQPALHATRTRHLLAKMRAQLTRRLSRLLRSPRTAVTWRLVAAEGIRPGRLAMTGGFTTIRRIWPATPTAMPDYKGSSPTWPAPSRRLKSYRNERSRYGQPWGEGPGLLYALRLLRAEPEGGQRPREEAASSRSSRRPRAAASSAHRRKCRSSSLGQEW